MRLVLSLDPSEVTFTEPRTSGPYPWLLGVGTLVHKARVGHHIFAISVDEAPKLDVQLNNQNRQASRVLGRPLRARAQVFEDDGSEYFTGIVQTIYYGDVLKLSLES